MNNYKIIRSRRKTMGLQVKADGLIVRAPIWMLDDEITAFFRKHRDWIEKHVAKVERQKKQIGMLPKLTQDDIHCLADEALKIIPERVVFIRRKWALPTEISLSATSIPDGAAARLRAI